MTGLQGDSRLLAKYLMQRALELDWKEGLLLSQELPLRIQQIANACAEVQHSLTTKPGARPLAVEAVLLGIDGIMDIDMDMDI
jgi:20S proteasome alpha/beta subunit